MTDRKPVVGMKLRIERARWSPGGQKQYLPVVSTDAKGVVELKASASPLGSFYLRSADENWAFQVGSKGWQSHSVGAGKFKDLEGFMVVSASRLKFKLAAPGLEGQFLGLCTVSADDELRGPRQLYSF